MYASHHATAYTNASIVNGHFWIQTFWNRVQQILNGPYDEAHKQEHESLVWIILSFFWAFCVSWGVSPAQVPFFSHAIFGVTKNAKDHPVEISPAKFLTSLCFCGTSIQYKINISHQRKLRICRNAIRVRTKGLKNKREIWPIKSFILNRTVCYE